MSTEAPAPPSPLHRSLRIEYLDFQNVADMREYRFHVYGPDSSIEFRLRIDLAAFRAAGVRIQDGPDVCYQKLLGTVAAGETVNTEVMLIDGAELVRYREAHTHVPKRRAWTPAPAAEAEAAPIPPPKRPRTFAPPRPAAPVLVASPKPPSLEAGQRVSHAVFGVGVTAAAASRDHIVVRFDDHDGPKTFVTSMLKVEVLSAPHTWETGPRGTNRPRPLA